MNLTITTVVAAINETLYGGQGTVTTASGLRAIRAGLRWVSQQAKFRCLHVKELEVAALAGGTKEIAHPANLRILDKIVLNDGTYDGAPLTLTSYGTILAGREDQTSSRYAQPTHYASRGAYFHLMPTSDGVYTPKISYWQNHPDITAYAVGKAFLFAEDFEEAVNFACTGKHLEQKGRKIEGNYYMALAVDAVVKLSELTDHQVRITKPQEF